VRHAYPVNLETEPDGQVNVTFDDVPEAITWGADRAEALRQAEDCLVSALACYVRDGRPLPRPSPARGRPVVAVPALDAAKLALHEAMLEAGATAELLAERLGKDAAAVRRLVDPLRASRIGDVERALAALGKRLEIAVSDAA
jgi:antitoxin HicB